MTRIVVTSASGANGDGYDALLCFSPDGDLAGPFSDDTRITDPRGLSLSPAGDLIYVTSGDDRVLALNRNGKVVLDSGRTEGLDPGGGTFAPDGRYCVTLRRRGTILALPPGLDTEGEPLLPDGVIPFPRGFGFGAAQPAAGKRPRAKSARSDDRSRRQPRGFKRVAIRLA
jgi:DNA-binding beta-propeller fold protein YncE